MGADESVNNPFSCLKKLETKVIKIEQVAALHIENFGMTYTNNHLINKQQMSSNFSNLKNRKKYLDSIIWREIMSLQIPKNLNLQQLGTRNSGSQLLEELF